MKSATASSFRSLLKHDSPHVHEFVFVDASVAVGVERLDELAGTLLVEPGHVDDRSDELLDRQVSVPCHVETVKVLHYLLLTALGPTSHNTTRY